MNLLHYTKIITFILVMILIILIILIFDYSIRFSSSPFFLFSNIGVFNNMARVTLIFLFKNYIFYKKRLFIFDMFIVDHLANFIHSLKNYYVKIGGICYSC